MSVGVKEKHEPKYGAFLGCYYARFMVWESR